MSDRLNAAVEIGHGRTENRGSPLAWTWFSHPRALLDPAAARVLVGAVTGGDGDVVVGWYDLESKAVGSATLHAALERDDHNGAALYRRPDGRYLAMYAKHNSDPYTRWRLSDRPGDPSSWGPERRLDNGAGTTYNNVLRTDDRLYSFTRATNWDPNLLVSEDDGESFTAAGRVITYAGSDDRPYPRYTGRDGVVHLITTEGHPHRVENGVYHGAVRDGQITTTDGHTLAKAIHEPTTDPTDVTDLTPVFEPNTVVGDERLTRAWTVDVAIDPRGHPVAVIQARVEDDRRDHRFLYAHWHRSEWTIEPLARAGGYLYPSEWDYTGLAALDPADPSRVVVSTPIDPRDPRPTATYGLYAGLRDDDGHWEWSALTPEDGADDLRPILVGGRARTALVWMRGRYRSYTDWETRAMCLPDPFNDRNPGS